MITHIKPSAIIFDFDDTLIDARSTINKSLASTLAHFNISDEVISSKNIDINRSLRDYFQNLFADNIQEAREVYYNHYIEYAKDLKALESSEEVLKLLRKNNVYTAVVSNKNGPRLRYEIHEKFLWKDYFNKIIGAGDLEEDKPSAIPAKFALQDAKIIDYSNVWFIGDSFVDLKTAENLGCKGILFGNADIKEEVPIYLNVLNHNELLRILKDIYV